MAVSFRRGKTLTFTGSSLSFITVNAVCIWLGQLGAAKPGCELSVDILLHS